MKKAEQNRKELGKKIKQARIQAHLTQAQLGKMVGRTGAAIAYKENGNRAVTTDILFEIAEATDKPISFFFQDEKANIEDQGQLLKIGNQIEQIKLMLENTGKKYKEMMDKSPDFVFISRIDNFKFVEVNQRACDFYGYTKKEFLKMEIFDIEVKPMIKKEVRRLYDTTPVGKVIELSGINRKKDGSEFHVNIRFTKLNEELALANVRTTEKL
jgi:PAS domain S-box-containing protein